MTQLLSLVSGLPTGAHLGLAVVLLAAGFLLILAEVFFVTFGVLGLTSAACFLFSFYLAYEGGGPWVLALFIVTALVCIPVMLSQAFKFLPRTRWGKKLVRDNPKYEDVTSTGVPRELSTLVGKHGVTVTRCRPAGMADIDGQRVDVVAEGMMIELNRPVEVVRVEGVRVVVRRLEESQGTPENK